MKWPFQTNNRTYDPQQREPSLWVRPKSKTVNNFGGTNNEGFAKVIEVTFSKRKYNKVRDNDEFEFPDMSIDQSNDPKLRDLKVKFEN